MRGATGGRTSTYLASWRRLREVSSVRPRGGVRGLAHGNAFSRGVCQDGSARRTGRKTHYWRARFTRGLGCTNEMEGMV